VTASVPGAFVFGKLPAHGDFVARGLSADAHQRWDDFLSTSLADARALFGDAFESRYDNAPAWRFVLPEATGAIAPSVDRAGRRFPVLLGRPGADSAQTASLAAACEDLLYRALGESMTVDALWDAVCAIEAAPTDDVAPAGWWIDGGAEAGIAPLPGLRPDALIARMLDVAEPAL
jgi:type VI secretion system protein ImpM